MYTIGGELYHHGILGMKWGKKNGPPYPLGAGDHSASEKKAGWRKSIGGGRNESLYDRFDRVAKSGIKTDGASKHKTPFGAKTDGPSKNKKPIGTRSENKENKQGLTDEQKDKLKKGAIITAGVLGTAAAIYFGNKYIDKKATKVLVDRAMADAQKYMEESQKYRGYENSLYDIGEHFKLVDNSSYNTNRSKDMASRMQSLAKGARDDALDLRSKAKYKNFTKEEKKRVVQEALKLRPKNDSDFISNDKLMDNFTKSELVDLADQARLKYRYRESVKLLEMAGRKVPDNQINSYITQLRNEGSILYNLGKKKEGDEVKAMIDELMKRQKQS